jgi:hypothetical protein
MATGSTAWISGIAGTALGIAIGFAAASFTRGDASGALADASARHSDADAAALTSRVDEIIERLRALEQGIRARSEPANADAPAPTATPVRQEDGLRELIESRFKELEAEIRRTSAGFGELSRLKPTPDVDAVTAYGREFAADRMRAIQRIAGCTYRDVILEFGCPTAKLAHGANVQGPSGGRVISWYWELPTGDDSLYIQFDAGVAYYSMYGDATRAKKDLSELGK